MAEEKIGVSGSKTRKNSVQRELAKRLSKLDFGDDLEFKPKVDSGPQAEILRDIEGRMKAINKTAIKIDAEEYLKAKGIKKDRLRYLLRGTQYQSCISQGVLYVWSK